MFEEEKRVRELGQTDSSIAIIIDNLIKVSSCVRTAHVLKARHLVSYTCVMCLAWVGKVGFFLIFVLG